MISQFTSEIIDKVCIELKKKKNLHKLKTNIVNPIIYYILKELLPYLFIIVIFILIIMVISFINMFQLLRIKQN